MIKLKGLQEKIVKVIPENHFGIITKNRLGRNLVDFVYPINIATPLVKKFLREKNACRLIAVKTFDAEDILIVKNQEIPTVAAPSRSLLYETLYTDREQGYNHYSHLLRKAGLSTT